MFSRPASHFENLGQAIIVPFHQPAPVACELGEAQSSRIVLLEVSNSPRELAWEWRSSRLTVPVFCELGVVQNLGDALLMLSNSPPGLVLKTRSPDLIVPVFYELRVAPDSGNVLALSKLLAALYRMRLAGVTLAS